MNRRELLQKSRSGALVIVLLLAGSPTQAADSVSSVTVLIAYRSVTGLSASARAFVALRAASLFSTFLSRASASSLIQRSAPANFSGFSGTVLNNFSPASDRDGHGFCGEKGAFRGILRDRKE
jgi:hypothetical protein